MSKIKEQRIVEMKFENKDFTAKAKESMDTLDKLEEKLKFDGAKKGAKNIETAINGINFEKLNEALDKINYRFSTTGIAMTTMLQKTVGSLAGKLVDVFQIIDQKGKQRALNLQKARFLLNGITNDAQKTANIINGPVNEAVSGTRFGLDEAALSASTLFASGITDTGKNGGLEKSLKAIATAATMTNSEFSEMAQIFSTVKSNGKIMTDQVRQFNFRGLNMYQELAKVYGKTEAEMTKMVSEGKVGYEDLIEAMQHFGDVSKKANETYEGALSNVKAALGRIGVLYYENHLEAMRRIMVSLIDTPKAPLNAFKSSLEDATTIFNHMEMVFADSVASMMRSGRVFNILTNIGQSFRHVMTAIYIISQDLGQAFDNVFPNKSALSIVEELSNGFENLIAIISHFVVMFKYTSLFEAFFESYRVWIKIIKLSIAAFAPGIKVLAGLLLNFAQAIDWLAQKWTTLLRALDEFGVLEGLADVINALLERLLPAGDSIVEFGKKIRSVFNKLLPNWGDYSQIFTKLANTLHQLAAFIRGDGEWIGSSLKGMFKGVDIAIEPVNKSFDRFSGMLGNLKKVTESSCNAIKKALDTIFGRTITSDMGKFPGIFGDINLAIDGIEISFIRVYKMVRRVWPFIREVMLWIMGNKIATGAEKIGNGVEGIGKAFSAAGDLIRGFGEKAGILTAKKSAAEKVFDAMKKLAVSVLILASAMWVVAQIPEDRFDKSIEAIITFALGLSALIAVAKGIGLMENKIIASFGTSMMLIAFAMRNIARALQIVSKIPETDLTKALEAFKAIVWSVVKLVAALGIFARVAGMMKADVITRMGVSIMLIANAMFVISLALGVMALAAHFSEGFDSAVQALKDIIFYIGVLVTFVGLLGFIEGAPKTLIAAGVAMTLIAFAMLELAVAVALLGLIPADVAIDGLERFGMIVLAVGALIGVLEAISWGTNGKALYGAAAAILAVAVAMNLLLLPITMLGALPVDTLYQGLASIISIMLILTVLMGVMMGVGGDAKTILAAGGAILIISAAMIVFAAAITALADVAEDDHLLSSMTAFVVGIVLMTGALIMLSGVAIGALQGAAALVVLSGAILIFSAAMYVMSQCDMLKVAGGLIMIAIAFAVFIVAAIPLGALIISLWPLFIAFGAALAAFAVIALIAGVALIAIGKGLEFCAKGIKMFNGADPKYAVEALKAFTDAFGALEVLQLGAIAVEIVALGIGLGMIAGLGAAAGLAVSGFSRAVDELLATDTAKANRVTAELANSFINFKSTYDDVNKMASAVDLLARALYSFMENVPVVSSDLQQLTFDLQDAAKEWSDIDFDPFIDELGKISIEINNKIISMLHVFINTGKYVVDGIKIGLVSGINDLYNAGVALGNAINQGVQDSLGIASPAKEMIKNGRYAAEGFMIGTESYYTIIRKQGIKLGNSLVLGVRNSTAEGGKSFRKYLNGITASMRKYLKNQNVSAYSNLATKLYLKSDEYKDAMSDLKEYYREYNRVYRQSQEDLKKTKQGSEDDRKEAISEYNSDIDQLNDLEKKITEVAKKMQKGPEKALKSLYKSIKQSVKSILSIENLEIPDLFSGLEKMVQGTALGQNSNTFLSGLSGSIKELATVAQSASDKFDLLNTSYDTGINLLERFSKVSTMTTRRLLVNAESQIKAYEEFRDSIARMRATGFNDDLVKELEAQGPQALKEIRGFLKMSGDQMDRYNELYDKKKEYESEILKKNMQQQMDTYQEFYDDLETLASRGLSQGIIDRLKQAGIEKAGFVKALLGLDNYDDVEQWYADSVEAVNEATEMEQEANKTFKTLSEWFDYNVMKENFWQEQLDKLRSAGIDERIIKQFEEMGSETGKVYVEAAIREINQDPANVQKINNSYKNLFKSQQDPAKKMLENITSSNDLVSEYEKNMNKLAKKLPRGVNNPLYKEIEAMGIEAGSEYAKAYLEADKETQKAIRQAMKEREELEAAEIKRQWENKLKQMKRWKSDAQKLSKLADEGVISKSLASELIEMGPQYADELNKIIHMPEKDLKAFSKEYTVTMKKVPELTASSVVDSMAEIAGTATSTFANVLSEKNIESITKDALKGIDTKSNRSSAKSGGKSVGAAATDGLGKGLNKDLGSTMKNWTDSLSKFVLDARNDKGLNGSIESLAKYIDDQLGTNLSSLLTGTVEKQKKTLTQGQTVAAKKSGNEKSTKDEVKMFGKATNSSGANATKGISVGMISKGALATVSKSSNTVKNDTVNSLNKAFGIKSPSRVTMAIGEYLTLGLAKGMIDNMRPIDDATNTLASNLETALTVSAQNIQNGVVSDYSINLTPNMANFDLSRNVEQASRIQGIFDSISGLNLELGRDANKDVVNAINDMRSDFQGQFDSLAATIQDLQLVMDSGALVGQIVNPMNAALGERIALAQRGVTA